MSQSTPPLVTASFWQQSDSNNKIIFAHPDIQELVTEQWFMPEYWQSLNKVAGESKGRNTTYFICHKSTESDELNIVLRHYYRGGLISKIIKDEFLYTGIKTTRAFAELVMLQQMTELNLPVPRPIAAMITKVNGLWCRNDILIETIEGAKDGFYWLQREGLSDSDWQNIGATIKRFHAHGVYHSDLNIHNILIDKNGNVSLIDFDRCGFKTPDSEWQQNNLSRLLRSLNKEKTLHSDFKFTQDSWQQLLAGYEQGEQ